MARFLIHRIILAIIQMLVVSTLVFLLMHIMPGDPAVMALGTERGADPSAVAEMRHTLGLDEPIGVQYTNWVINLARLDLGKSITDKTPVNEHLAQRLPRTIELAAVSIFLASIIGIIFGLTAALKRETVIDLATTSAAALGISVPVYVMGTLMIVLFSLKLGLLPSSGFVDFSENPVKHLQRLILPSVTIALGLSAAIARMTRSSMLESLSREFVQTLRAKGLPEKHVILKHVFRNSLIPIVTIIGLQLGNLIGGTVLIEYLFNWPGLSTLLVKAISYRDYPVIQGCIMVISIFYIMINMAIDIIYGVLDPRVR